MRHKMLNKAESFNVLLRSRLYVVHKKYLSALKVIFYWHHVYFKLKVN